MRIAPHSGPTNFVGMVMLTANRWAFKEWAAVCAALMSGRQSLILRKGGIHEGSEGFRVEHREFWLFATQFHQQPDALVPEAYEFWDAGKSLAPNVGCVALPAYCVVEAVEEIRDPMALSRMRELHIWSEQTVMERFHYRSPGLFALMLRVYRAGRPLELPDSPIHFAGCRSWVDLPSDLPTAGLAPALSDSQHAAAMERIRQALPTGMATC